MGAFAIYNDCNMDSTIISNLFIDEYMKDASEVEIKVYLYLVRMMSAGRSTSISEMAALFGHSEKEIGRALVYWNRQGLLVLNRDARNHLVSIHLCPVEPRKETAAPESAVSENDRVIPIQPILEGLQSASAGANAATRAGAFANDTAVARTGASADAIAATQAGVSASAAVPEATSRLAEEDKAQLLFIVEQYIGKPLSPNEMQTIYYIADELHFSSDLIDYLVQYCVERGKKDFRYIEKVALNWKESGIQTAQDAQKASVRQSRTKRAATRGNSSSRAKNSFNEFQQNTYDFEALEQALLKQN